MKHREGSIVQLKLVSTIKLPISPQKNSLVCHDIACYAVMSQHQKIATTTQAHFQDYRGNPLLVIANEQNITSAD